MKTYRVTVDNKGTKRWYNEQGQLHNEHGPAVEWADGTKWWYLNGEYFTEAQFNARTKQSTCDGKVVEIDGKKYKLTLV